jgi:hypothetical protein
MLGVLRSSNFILGSDEMNLDGGATATFGHGETKPPQNKSVGLNTIIDTY